MTDPLRAAAQAHVDAECRCHREGTHDEQCELIVTENTLRAALAAFSPDRILAIEAESRNATLDEVVRAVEGLPVSNTYLRDPDSETGAIRAADALDRAAVLDAVKALRGEGRT